MIALFINGFLAPTVIFSFHSVQLFSVLFGVVLSVTSVLLWVRTLGARMSWQALAAGMVLMLGSYPVIHGVLTQNLTLVVGALIAGAAASISAGALGVAGTLLALAMIKPHLTLPVTAWLLVWAAGDWPMRKALPLAFLATMTCLLVGAELLLPGWVWHWREAISAYTRYNQATKPALLQYYGDIVGGFLWLTLLLTLLVLGWRTRRQPARTDAFKLTLVCMLCGTVVMLPKWHMYDQVLFLPVVVLGVFWRNEYFRLSAVGRLVVVISACLFLGPWFAASTLSLIAVVSPVIAQTASLAVFFFLVNCPIPILLGILLLGMHKMRISSTASGLDKRDE